MEDLNILKKKLVREKSARKEAERILEEKALELYRVNQELIAANSKLEEKIITDNRIFSAKEENYKKLVEEANDLICNFNLNGEFTYLNTVAEKILGRNKEQIIGRSFREFIHDEYYEQIFDTLKSSVKNSVNSTYLEFPLKEQKGNSIWLGQNTSLAQDDSGNYYFSVIARDITLQKEAEFEIRRIQKKLESSEMKFRSIIENMELGLLEQDANGLITKAHPYFCYISGYREEELLNRNPNDFLFFIGSDSQEPYNSNYDLENQGVSEICIKKKSGEIFWVLISSAPFGELDGDQKGFISIFYNMTQIKNLQKNLIQSREIAEKAQNSQKEFLASISHEIQTPLNAIIGMSHLLADTKLSSEQFDLMEQIAGSSYILKSLIADLLGIAKIDSGIMEAKKKPFDLQRIFGMLEKVLKIKLVGKNIDLKFHVDEKLKFKLLGDGLLINQVLMNLLSNAIKFTSAGTVSADATIIRKSNTEALVRLSVTDMGIGISENAQSYIFEPYRQAHEGIKTQYGGTGLGLSISKKLVNLMGGELSVISEIDKGSTFYFDLTFDISEKIISANRNKKAIISAADQIKLPILIVEDNTLNQNYICKLLEKWGLKFQVANNGKVALEFLEDQQFSLILMDLQMPVMDGFATTKWIRNNTDLQVKKVPIIAVTASTLLNKRQDVIDAGMNDYLSKPFSPDQLADAINRNLAIAQNSSKAKYKTSKPDVSDSAIYLEELDSEYLTLIYDDDISYAFEMFEIFLENIPAEFNLLISAVMQDNLEEVHTLAHKIKPTFSMVGLTKENNMLSTLEQDAKTGKSLTHYVPKLIEVKEEKISIIKLQFEKLKKHL